MTRIERIEKDIRSLSREERAALRKWFLAYEAEVWDKEIEADVKAGKLDALADEALEAHRSGKSRPL